MKAGMTHPGQLPFEPEHWLVAKIFKDAEPEYYLTPCGRYWGTLVGLDAEAMYSLAGGKEYKPLPDGYRTFKSHKKRGKCLCYPERT